MKDKISETVPYDKYEGMPSEAYRTCTFALSCHTSDLMLKERQMKRGGTPGVGFAPA
jgi:hypothetical protein